MKIQYASDIHLEFDQKPLRRNHVTGDVLVLAGDIAGSPRELVAFLKSLGSRVPVLYVLGNHEFYGHRWDQAESLYRWALEKECPWVTLLEDEAVAIQGVRFLGTTLWADFLGGTQGEAAEGRATLAWEGSMDEGMRDFQKITVGGRISGTNKGGGEGPVQELLRWTHVRDRFEISKTWLKQELAVPFEGPTVVVTHHAPSFQSNPPHYGDSIIRGAFCTDLEDMILEFQPQAWIHGHLHNASDYKIGRTRVVCNPHGYPWDKELDWSPETSIEV